MREPPRVHLAALTCSAVEALARFAPLPMVMLYSGGAHGRWSRWSVVASPRVRFQFDGRSRWIGDPPPMLSSMEFTHDPLIDLDQVLGATRFAAAPQDAAKTPFWGGWIGYLSYDLGRWIEPRAQHHDGARDDRQWPLIDLAWCPDALMRDELTGRWLELGMGLPELSTAEFPVLESCERFTCGILRPQMTRRRYEQLVQRTIEYIAAGDIFQANLSQRFTASFEGSTRALAAAAFVSSRPRYGAYLELDERCVISLSPELFLQVDAGTRRIVTRPIKGTRPAHATAQSLADSPKDAAELHMIIDLMRNDLGRVCEFGSVRVDCARAIETHETVHHGVGEVAGALRGDVQVSDILRATFPGGSITGAPKIRAMQIIDELEPVRRGPYCGAIGMFSDCGNMALNIAIRSMLLTGDVEANRSGHLRGLMDYSAGAGIVADSQPGAEYQETLDKCAVLKGVCGGEATPANGAGIEVMRAATATPA